MKNNDEQKMSDETFPPLVRHWRKVLFYVGSHRLTASAILCNSGNFKIEFDVVNHRLVTETREARKQKLSN